MAVAVATAIMPALTFLIFLSIGCEAIAGHWGRGSGARDVTTFWRHKVQALLGCLRAIGNFQISFLFYRLPKKVFLPLNILLVYKESLSGLSNQANSGLFAVGTLCVCVTVFVQ